MDPAERIAERIAERAGSFAERAGSSARSVLVTIFGDSIVPVGGEVWLADLIALCAPLGINDRLVRTSMFRLSAGGWFETERIGRRSRYRLTATATEQFATAERRIYHRSAPPWDGRWTLVFLGALRLPRARRDELAEALHWAGFVTLVDGVMAVPRVDPASVARSVRRAAPDAVVPVATAQFDELDALLSADWLRGALDLDQPAGRYHGFIDAYRWTAHTRLRRLADHDAFLLRTMLLHDWRRARLSDPDLPAALLPADWPAGAAYRLAATTYRAISPAAWRWLAGATGLTVADAPPDRFPDEAAHPHPA